jgi:Kef-type K+ transport system membrane component KefB
MGMVLAPYFLRERILAQRMRVIAFTLLTPFYFLLAGSLVKMGTVISAAELIALFLSIKMLTKFIGIWPLTKKFKFERREGMYTTLMMSTLN